MSTLALAHKGIGWMVAYHSIIKLTLLENMLLLEDTPITGIL